LRVLILDTYYPAVFEHLYASNPGLSKECYDEQLAALMRLQFGTTDAYSVGLRQADVEADDVIANCAPLQARWDLENGRSRLTGPRLDALKARFPRRLSRWFDSRTVRAQIEAFDPDVLYLQALEAIPGEELEFQRRAGRLIVAQIASALPAVEVVRRFDLILTSFPHYVERIRDLGVDCEYFRIGFDTRVLDRLHAAGIDTDPAGEGRVQGTCFVGGLNPWVHSRGTAFLERLAERVDLSVWGYGAELLDDGSPLKARYRGVVWGLDMYEVLARSRIAVNRHVDAAEGYSNNMRLFEATGVGALLCTEESPNLGELFAPGEEVVAYSSLDDLADKISYYLEHDAERVKIARAGQERTLGAHTYDQLMVELKGILEKRL